MISIDGPVSRTIFVWCAVLCACVWAVLAQHVFISNPTASPSLRAGRVVPQHHGRRLHASEAAADAVPTRSLDWGHLRDNRQVIVGTADADQPLLLDHLERYGCRVSGYLGSDGGILLTGPADTLERALDHEHVSWVAPFEAEHKLAPEWDDVLARLDRLRLPGNSFNSTRASNASFSVDFESAPLDVLLSERGEQLFGVRAVFPSAMRPRPHDPTHERHDVQNARIRRHDEEVVRRNSGSAAVKDWARAVEREFSVAHLEHNGRDAVRLYVLREDIPRAIQWLAERHVVHWVEPVPRMVVMNRQASSITQSCQPVPSTNAATNTMPKYHPFWSAGIQGQGMVIGIGDSGLDYRHCFFADPDTDWEANIVTIDRVLTFTSETHRKIRLYRAFADFRDDNGHGTHTCGTLAGMPYGNTVAGASAVNIGMAPEAKLAFIDLSSVRDGERIVTPGNLAEQYFRYTTAVGATVHSDSWGSTNTFYDYESYQIDQYCWDNPTFLPVFPAGNDGNLATSGGSGTSTVNSPATAKNCLAVGATETAGTRAAYSTDFVTFTGTASINGVETTSFPVLLSSFSPSFGGLPNAEYVLVGADPIDACSSLRNGASLVGKIALIERGECEFVQKARAAEQAGAAAVIIYDNVAGAYFIPDTSGGTVNVPVGFVPRRIGQNLVAAMTTGQTISISMGPGAPKEIGYENQASFSSQGPVNPDRRIKPDIMAPGIVASAAAGTSCSTTYFSGTSMATPVVAGNVALVQQYFKEGFYPTGTPVPENGFMPTSSLVKAVLMGGAKPITGYEADTGLPVDPAPSFRQGYGRVFLGGSLQLQDNPYNPKSVQVLDSVDIVNGQKHVYCVTGTGGPLSITVAWTDYPPSQASRKALMNDIDLVVRAEGFNGIPFLGNGGDIDDSTKPDDVNNVEQVRWEFLPAGRVSIEIIGTQIYSNQVGPQPYSLVVNGDFEGTILAPSPGENQAECPVVSAVITSGPSGVTNAPDAVFEFGVGPSGTSSGIRFQCMLEAVVNGQSVNGEWVDCSSPATYSGLPDGEFVFSVKPAQESSVAKQTFVVDRTPPTLQVESVPAPVGLGAFRFMATDTSDIASVECKIDGEGVQGTSLLYAGEVVAAPVKQNEWFPCGPSGISFGWLMPGQTNFNTRATDTVGNQSPVDSKAVVVPADPSRTYITSGPFNTIGKGDVSYTLALPSGPSGTQAGECAVVAWPDDLTNPGVPQQQDWRPCGESSQPVDLGVITNGKYSFFARGVGAPLEIAAVSTFTVDEIAPTVGFDGAPTVITEPDASIPFAASEEGSTTECRLSTSEEWTPCESPAVYGNLTDGQYVLEVRATDAVGNTGDAQQHAFSVDTTPPTVTVDYPVATRDPTMTISFVAEDANGSGIANTTCLLVPVRLVGKQVDNSTVYDRVPCSSPWTIQLEEGKWEYSIVATDNAGLSSTNRPLSVWMDTVPPVPTITSAPANDTVNAGGSVTFDITDGSPGPEEVGGSPVLWQGYLSQVSTSIEDQPVDTATPAGGGTTIQSVQSVQSVQSANSTTTTAAVEAANDPLGPGDLDTWANCTTTGCVYSGLGQGTYAFVARGVDAAGNQGPDSPTYTFRLEGASNALPTWALIVIIVGSCVAGILIIATIWCCCRKPSAPGPHDKFPTPGRVPSYDVNSYAVNSYAADPYANNQSFSPYQSTGFQNGYARPFAGAVANDPIEAQRQALGQYAARGGPAVNSEEEELRLAMAMSLSEQNDRRYS